MEFSCGACCYVGRLDTNLRCTRVSSDLLILMVFFIFFFQAEDGIRDYKVTGVQTCALPISMTPWGGFLLKIVSGAITPARPHSLYSKNRRFVS